MVRIDPAEPMDRIEPDDPIDRIDPAEPIDRIEPDDPIDRIDPTDPTEAALRTLKALAMLPAERVDHAESTDARLRWLQRELSSLAGPDASGSPAPWPTPTCRASSWRGPPPGTAFTTGQPRVASVGSTLMLDEFLATDGVEERAELRSRVGFMALHGGLEAATFEIAEEAARRCGASFYGIRQPEHLEVHVPSHRHRRGVSAALDRFCDHVELGVSLHGYGGVRSSPRRWVTISVGGRGRAEATVVAEALRRRLSDYDVLDDLDEIPRGYRGMHPDNPVNRLRGAGVQLELPPRVRGTSPIWAGFDRSATPWVPHTEALLGGLVDAVGRLAG